MNSKAKSKEMKAISHLIKTEMGNIRASAKATKVSSMTMAPSAVSRVFKPYYTSVPVGNKGQCRVSGGDLLTPIQTTGANNFTGTVLSNFVICPLSTVFQNTKIYYESLRYEKFRFRKLIFHWCPDAPTSTSGSIVMGYDPDPADTNISMVATTSINQYQIGFATVQTLLGFQDSVKGNVWESFSLNCKTIKNDPQDFYYTSQQGGDARLFSQGQVYVALGGQTGTNILLGSLGVEYEIDFFDPSLDQLNPMTTYKNTVVQTPDNRTNFGFNTLLAAAIKDVNIGNNQYPINIDNLGAAYISIPPGVHVMDYTAQQAAQTITPTFTGIANNILQSVTTSLIDDFRVTGLTKQFLKIISPPGGSKLYSSIGGSAATASFQQYLRMLGMAIPYVL